MASPQPSGEDLDWLVDRGREWIKGLRTADRPRSVPLVDPVKAVLDPFFARAILDNARCLMVPAIENPPFRAEAIARHFPPDALDFAQMAGLTFQDTFFVSQLRPIENLLALIFHELVHVVQYEILGVDELVKQYVHGLADGGYDYFKIPAEIVAYDLQARFEAHQLAGVDVMEEIRQRLPH